MSVYTKVDRAQLESFLAHYEIGEFQGLEPIAAGITNTNYFLDTREGRFVLTLYEHHSRVELDYMLGLQQHLVSGAVRCSSPVSDLHGRLFSTLNNRPAAIIEGLSGSMEPTPGEQHCEQIGAELAKFHIAGAGYKGHRLNPRGIDWISGVAEILAVTLDPRAHLEINATLEATANSHIESLPSGPIHADLFHDNALFQGFKLSGILDFDYACDDCFILDIAILINDWCIDSDNQLVNSRVHAVLDGYRQHRDLQTAETAALPLMLRVAALRFWLSRLYDATYPLPGELTFIKNPEQYRHMHHLRSSAEGTIEGLPSGA